MLVTPDLDTAHRAGPADWKTLAGDRVTLHIEQDSPSSERAHELVRQSDAIVDGLTKLLEPSQSRSRAPIDIFVADGGRPFGPDDAALLPNGSTDAEAGSRQDDTLFWIDEPGLDAAGVARRLTRCLIRRWYGPAAGDAPIFGEGIAAIVAAGAGLGPSIAESDGKVREELEAGRSISTSGEAVTGGEADHGADKQRFQPAAASFVSFLVTHFGASALREYLAGYDPTRTDQAAIAAYHRPLAVLQEEWTARLHSRANDRAMFRSFLRQVLPLLRPYRWKQLEILFYLILAAGYNIVQPYAIKIVIDRLTVEVRSHPTGGDPGMVFARSLAPFLLLLLGIYVLNGVVSLRRAYTVSWLNQNVLNTLQVRMFAHLQMLAHNFYLKARIGDIMARLNDDLDTVQSALSQVTNKALYQCFTVVGALAALLMLTRKSPMVAVPILCIVPLFAVTYAALRTRNKQASREQRRAVGQAMADVQQHLSAHAVVKAFGLERRTIADYASRVKTLQRSKLRLSLLSALTDLSEDSTTAIAQLVIFGVGGYLVLRGGGHGLGVGDLSALLVLVKSIFSPIASLAGIGQTIQQATGAMERVSELFDEPVTIQNRPGAVPLPPLSRDIRLENVTLRYGGKRSALRNLSVTIPAFSHVAIVGLSGGGKSSLVNLMMRFWDPEQGRILFDGHDLRDVTLESLRAQIGLVFQETFIFDTTIRENIAIGRPSATDAEIADAARAAQLESLIESMPAGYDTIPGENGARLSVGQKQRIAIARAFLRNPRILILDEATSALDPQTEAGVLDTLADLARGRTTISVTHRVVQAASADLILVLDTGRLVEQGRHDELMKAGGLYRRLFDEAAKVAIPSEDER